MNPWLDTVLVLLILTNLHLLGSSRITACIRTVASQAVLSGSFVNEIVARIQSEAFDYLDGPVKRVTAPHAPVPFSPFLEDAFVPSAERVIAAVKAIG